MKIIGTLDTKLIALTQDGYLWLWDRFGVPVGYMTFLSWVLMGIPNYPLHPWTTIIVIGWCGLVAASAVWLQLQHVARYNEHARNWTGGYIRIAYMVLFTAFMMRDVIAGDRSSLIVDVLAYVIGYLWCVQVRDREPPQKQAFAKGAA